MTNPLTSIVQASLDRAAEPDLPLEVQAPDGSVYRARDSADAVVNLQLQAHLRRRTRRGRDPMVAHLLGFFEGHAAWLRGLGVQHFDFARVKVHGVLLPDGDTIRELEDVT